MRRSWKKALAMALAFCTVLSLSTPVAVSAEEDTTTAEEFKFPEFGDAYSVGEVLTGGMALTEYALLMEKGGEQYLMAAAKGGTLYVLKLSEFMKGGDGGGTFIEAAITHGIGIPRGIVADSNGVSYTIGDNGYVFCYDFYKNTTARINIPSGSRAITIDKDDNLYVGVEAGAASQIIKIDLKNGNKQTVLFETDELTGVGAMHWGTNGDVYMWGARKGYAAGCYIYRIDSNTGAVKAKHTNETNNYGYYLSYIDGVLFGGHSSTQQGAHVYDGETLEPLDLGIPSWIMGVVTTPTEEGKSYLQVRSNGVYEYDTKTRTVKRVDGLNAWNINLRIRDPYMDVNYDGIKGKCVVTMASGHGLPSILSIEGQGFREMEALVEETTSPATLRSVATAVAGVKVHHSKDEFQSAAAQEAAVYIGGYLSGNVAAYYPGADEEYRVDSPIFSNGHAQTDSMLVYKDKLYAGCYNGGYVVQYDPATDIELQMIPDGLKGQWEQARVHGLSAGDDKIFFSTIPGDQTLGGVIGWIDIPKFEAGAPIEEYMYVERNVVFEQAVTSIVYDEERNILFGSSSCSGGTNTTASQEEGLLLAYDVDNKKVLGTFSVRAGANPNSDMVWDMSENGKAVMPWYLGGIARDPSTGKFWGTVSKCIFSFEYNEKNNTMKVHEEYAHPTSTAKSHFPIGGNPNWFPRPFAFDGKGHFYIWIVGEDMYRFDVNDPANPIVVSEDIASRMYALGTDGNLYIGSGLELYKIALNRVDIVKGMIDGVEPRFGDQVKLARQSYEALTSDEKAQISEEYVKKLAALEGGSKIFLQVQADKVADAIDEIGAVTVSAHGAIANARQKYELLEEAAKGMVSNYQDLVKCEEEFARISAASSWKAEKKIVFNLSKKGNPRIGTTPLQMIKFDHITNDPVTEGAWEFGLSTGSEKAMKFNSGDHLQLNFGGGWIAFRVKISQPGLYTVSMSAKGGSSTVKNGGLYMFDCTGMKTDHMYDLINNEAKLKSQNSQNFVCTVDYSVAGTAEQGKWYCESAGEYLLVLNRLAGDTGTYGRPMSFTFTKKDGVTDPMVEMAKSRIDAIGKVNKNSGAAIDEARITFDSLTEAQKALIYAPKLADAETQYKEIQASNTDSADAAAVALVQIQIDAIGEVTTGSGPAIKAAREAFDALSKKLQKKVENAKKLTEAEAAYAALTANTGDENDGSMTTLIVVIVIVVLAAAGAVVAIVIGKKKKNSVGGGALDAPQTEATPTEATPSEE